LSLSLDLSIACLSDLLMLLFFGERLSKKR